VGGGGEGFNPSFLISERVQQSMFSEMPLGLSIKQFKTCSFFKYLFISQKEIQPLQI
jgi:hypothetical protein